MTTLCQKFSKPLYWTILAIVAFHWQCFAEIVDEHHTEKFDHCSIKSPNKVCTAHDHSREAYTESHNRQTTSEDGTTSPDEADYQDFLHRSMGRLEGMLEESRDQVLKKLRKIMDKMAHSRDHMIKKLDSLLDTVSHSRLVTEIDHLLEEVSHSKLIEDMKSLPRELKESLLLSVRNRSYMAAGIMVMATMVILVGGSLYFAWCHHDGWSLSYDYKTLTMGVSAVTSATSATKDQDKGQDNTDDLTAVEKENIEIPEMQLDLQKLNSEGRSSEIRVSNNGVLSSTTDVIRCETTDCHINECKKNEDGLSVPGKELEESSSSEKRSGSTSNGIHKYKAISELSTAENNGN